MSASPAVFLDRDGTIVADPGYLGRPEQLRLLDGAAAGLLHMLRLGYRLVIVTNQSGVARGYFREDDVARCHDALLATLADQGVAFAGVYTCPYHPTAGVGPYRRESPDRKPAPGMLLRAAADLDLDLAASYMIGDKYSDVRAGQAAGCRTILLGEPRDAATDAPVTPDFRAADLRAAAALLDPVTPRHDLPT